VLVVAPNQAAKSIKEVDPLKGPLEVTLQMHPAISSPLRVILGRVTDRQGEPIGHATISINSTTTWDGITSSEPPKGTDLLAVTNDRGEFDLRSGGEFQSMSLQVEAQNYAKANFSPIQPGPNRHAFEVTTGASLTGRVLLDGKALSNASVGVADVNRLMGDVTGDFVMGTDGDGRFLFSNLPPTRRFALYLLMASVQRLGAMTVRTIAVGGDDSTTDAGDLTLHPGHRLAGRVVLTPQSDVLNIETPFAGNITKERVWRLMAIPEKGGDPVSIGYDKWVSREAAAEAIPVCFRAQDPNGVSRAEAAKSWAPCSKPAKLKRLLTFKTIRL
jgi:hypothetical protein